jgi:hypothetical protein
LSNCRFRFARKVFSEAESFVSALGRQLPFSFFSFPATGSYPGQHRFVFFVGMYAFLLFVGRVSPRDATGGTQTRFRVTESRVVD